MSGGQSKHSGSHQLIDRRCYCRSELCTVLVLPAEFVPVMRPGKDVLQMLVIMALTASLFLPTVVSSSSPIWYISTSSKHLSQ
jgi:hypothetical protein